MTSPKVEQSLSGPEVPQPNSFTQVAPYYDELMASVPYKFWIEYVVSLFRAHKFAPISVLDLACGTGSASLLMSDRGYDVTGTDLSPEMIEVARRKAFESGNVIDFVAQDASELHIEKRFDAVVSLFDSLNNIIEPSALASSFARVYDHLEPHGIFVFDVNTEVAFTAGMFNQKSHPIDGPLQYIWRSSYDKETRLCTVRMDFRFCPDDGAGQQQFQEVHVQRAYGKDELLSMLNQAGFKDITIYDAYTHKPPKKRSDRLFFVAIKDQAANVG